MKLEKWILKFKPDWDKNFKKFDRRVQQRILKKFDKMKEPKTARGMHYSKYQVEEVGQYRIAFIINTEKRMKEIHFVGNHKQYEKWYRGWMQ